MLYTPQPLQVSPTQLTIPKQQIKIQATNQNTDVCL
jgi:hypothetical protein